MAVQNDFVPINFFCFFFILSLEGFFFAVLTIICTALSLIFHETLSEYSNKSKKSQRFCKIEQNVLMKKVVGITKTFGDNTRSIKKICEIK